VPEKPEFDPGAGVVSEFFQRGGAVARPISSAKGSQSIERALNLIKEIHMCGKDGARTTDLVRRCQMEYPTTHRILSVLVEQRVLRKDAGTRRYFLGQLIYELGLSVEPRVDIRRHCDEMMRKLANEAEDTIFLSIRSGLDVVCIDRKEGAFPIKTFVFDVGSRRPLGIGAAGLALLMADPPEEVARILKANRVHVTRYGKKLTVDELVAIVDYGRASGYIMVDDTAFPGVRAISIPFDLGPEAPRAAVSIAAVSARLPPRRVRDLVAVIRTEIDNLCPIGRLD